MQPPLWGSGTHTPAGIPFAPGYVPKYESNERFSCMIITTCWMLWIPSAGPASADAAAEQANAAAANPITSVLNRTRPPPDVKRDPRAVSPARNGILHGVPARSAGSVFARSVASASAEEPHARRGALQAAFGRELPEAHFDRFQFVHGCNERGRVRRPCGLDLTPGHGAQALYEHQDL